MGLLVRKAYWLPSEIKLKLQDWCEPRIPFLFMANGMSTGEMESTAMSLFCRWQALIHLTTSDRSPPILRKAWTTIAKNLNFHDLDTGLSLRQASPQANSKSITLDSDIHEAYLSFLSDHNSISPKAFVVQSYPADGVTYCSFNKSPKHSLIYFRNQDSSSHDDISPGQIRLIFQHYRIMGKDLVNDTFAAVHQYEPMELLNDPFTMYPDFRANIYHKEPISKVTVIQVSQIYCHANLRPWNSSSALMRAINRVGFHAAFRYITPLTIFDLELLKYFCCVGDRQLISFFSLPATLIFYYYHFSIKCAVELPVNSLEDSHKYSKDEVLLTSSFVFFTLGAFSWTTGTGGERATAGAPLSRFPWLIYCMN